MAGTWKWLLCSGAISASLAPARAQQQIPPVDPGRVDERLRPPPTLPEARPVEIPQLPAQQASPDAQLSVRLTAIRFEGAESVPLDVLDAIAAPYLNRDMPLSEVFALAEAVTAEYRRRGLVLSRAVVGPQRIEGGVLTLQVIEGRIGAVRIEGDAGGYAAFLRRYAAPLDAPGPARADAITQTLLRARDLQGAEVQAVLTPAADQFGAADLTLAVERRPIEGYAAIDNRGSRWLGPVQIFGALSFNDALGGGERITLTGVSAPVHKELGFLSLTYEQPVGSSGLRLSAFGSYTETRPGDALRALGLSGKSTTWGVAARQPLVRTRESSLYARLVFTARDSESANFVIDPIFRDRIRTVQGEVFGNYAGAWGGVVTVRLSVTQGLDLFDATLRDDRAKSRATGSGRFTRGNFELGLVQRIAGDLHVQVSGIGQYTRDSLLAAEEFGIGAENYGRAYDPSEITGDIGVAGRIEAFYAHRPRFGLLQPFAYYEAGRVQQNDPLPGEPGRSSLESAGIGLRIGLNEGVNVSMEIARPFGRDVAAEGDRDARGFFSVSASF